MAEQYIKYEARLYVMICRICNTTITKNGTKHHYREDHKTLPRMHTGNEASFLTIKPGNWNLD